MKYSIGQTCQEILLCVYVRVLVCVRCAHVRVRVRVRLRVRVHVHVRVHVRVLLLVARGLATRGLQAMWVLSIICCTALDFLYLLICMSTRHARVLLHLFLVHDVLCTTFECTFFG